MAGVILGDYNNAYENNIIDEARSDEVFQYFKQKYWLDKNNLESEEEFNGLPLLFTNIESLPIELCLYNDTNIIKNPFVKNIGAHEMYVAENADELTSKYIVDAMKILKNLESKTKNEMYETDGNVLKQSLLGQYCGCCTYAIKTDLSKSPLFMATNLGMEFDLEKFNKFIDVCYEDYENVKKTTTENSSDADFIQIITNEIKNLVNFANIKIAENIVLNLSKESVLSEKLNSTFNVLPKIINSTNIMYFIEDQSQNRDTVEKLGFKNLDDQTYFESLRNAKKEFSNIKTFIEDYKKGRFNDLEDLEICLTYQNIMKEMQANAFMYMSSDELETNFKDNSYSFLKFVNKPYDEKSKKIAFDRFYKNSIALGNMISNGFTDVEEEKPEIPNESCEYQKSNSTEDKYMFG